LGKIEERAIVFAKSSRGFMALDIKAKAHHPFEYKGDLEDLSRLVTPKTPEKSINDLKLPSKTAIGPFLREMAYGLLLSTPAGKMAHAVFEVSAKQGCKDGRMNINHPDPAKLDPEFKNKVGSHGSSINQELGDRIHLAGGRLNFRYKVEGIVSA
jgi:hypothetical protein